MKDIVIFALAMATIGQIGLCISILLIRSVRSPVYLPLAAFFGAVGILSSGYIIPHFLPALETHFIILNLPACLLLGPSLWLYVEGLTAETPWRFHFRQLRHLILFGISMFLAGLLMSLPMEEQQAIFIRGDNVTRLYPMLLVTLFFILILGWLVQSGYYVVRIFRHLGRYRNRLKDLFASNDHRELGWIGALFFIIGGIWLISVTYIISENFFALQMISHRAGAVMSLILVWSLALWGLRQKPGFEGRYLDKEPDPDPEEKYQRSALGDEQSNRIAEKIKIAMSSDRLYLDPNLSLKKLAASISIVPNYISQTLNQTMGKNFFDYVNSWRIDDAKLRIISSDETILDISLAVGFNARSSFYKAFKRETGKTPSEFRKAHKQS